MSTDQDVRVGDRFETDQYFSYKGTLVDIDVTDVYESLSIAFRVSREGTTVTERDIAPRAFFERMCRRLPREAPTIEEQRAALKPGDVIKDPALLAKGMRFGTDALGEVWTIEGRAGDEEGWNCREARGATAGAFDHITKEQGRRFLGWAQEEKPVEPPLCEGPTEGDMSNLLKPQPAPLSKALPFKRHPDCESWHTVKRLCLSCEELIAGEMTKRPAPEPPSPEPHRYSPSGLGGVVGHVLSRLR